VGLQSPFFIFIKTLKYSICHIVDGGIVLGTHIGHQ
jgi:hypothetical protein